MEDYKELQMIENVKKVALEIDKYRKALEEIRNDIMSNKSVCTECIKIAKRINEVLDE